MEASGFVRLVIATDAFALNGIRYSGFPLILDDRRVSVLLADHCLCSDAVDFRRYDVDVVVTPCVSGVLVRGRQLGKTGLRLLTDIAIAAHASFFRTVRKGAEHGDVTLVGNGILILGGTSGTGLAVAEAASTEGASLSAISRQQSWAATVSRIINGSSCY
jgi:hypothetical protein